MYLSSKLNETPVRLRDLINTYIFLTARIKHLLSLPADQPFPTDAAGPSRLGGAGYNGAGGSGKGKERDTLWDGFMFEVPGFHDEVFWDCESAGDELRNTGLSFAGKDVIVASEMQILKRLGFNMQVGHRSCQNRIRPRDIRQLGHIAPL